MTTRRTSLLNVLGAPPPQSPLFASFPATGEPTGPETTRLIDSFGRRLTYLRVSVTDRCNLRCTYCLPADTEFPFGERAFLSPAETETIVASLPRLGIRRDR